MGLFSSKKSTSVNTTNQFYTTNLNAQSSGGPVAAGEGNVITVTDNEAVANALGFAGSALIFADDAQERAAGLTLGLIDRYQAASSETISKVLSETRAQSKDARDFALSAVRTETQALSRDVLKLGAVSLVVLGSLFMFQRGK